ncbi:MAG: hypothetical protein K2N72_13665 [Oscillospiraceae bacterium]|nr:hypothetical protein [Oscillospiraceae bacterium]
MLIDVNKFKENADESFGKIRDNFIARCDWDIYRGREKFTVKFGKDISFSLSGRNMFGGDILRHADYNKCLFSPLHGKLSPRSKEYTFYYFDGDRLVSSEFPMPGYGSRITFYLYDNNAKYLVTFFVMNNERGMPSPSFSELVHSVYDDENRIVSCEIFNNKTGSVSASREYYEYEGKRLIRAVKFEEYSRDYKPDKVMLEICPTLIINPFIYKYNFEYAEAAVFCEIIRKYSREEDTSKRFELKNAVLAGLKKYGVDCFEA